MMNDLLGVIAVFLLAGAVKGVTGLGLPTVAMSLLGLWMTPIAGAALLVVPSLVTNIAQCLGPNLRALASRLWPAWLASSVATVLTPSLPGGQGSARMALGVVLIAYGLWSLLRGELPPVTKRVRTLGASCGLLTGVVTAWTGVFVLPMVPFLQAMRLGRDEIVQAMGLSFTISTLALAVRVQGQGAGLLGPMSAWALAAALVGLGVGTWLRSRMDALAFRRALFGMLVLLGVANLVA